MLSVDVGGGQGQGQQGQQGQGAVGGERFGSSTSGTALPCARNVFVVSRYALGHQLHQQICSEDGTWCVKDRVTLTFTQGAWNR